MSLAQIHTPTEADDFSHSVARNIRSLLAMRETTAQQLAAHLGMSAPKLSQRMTGRSGWQAVELHRIARAFEVDLEVVFAGSEAEFREALARSRCSYTSAEVSVLAEAASVLRAEAMMEREIEGQQSFQLVA